MELFAFGMLGGAIFATIFIAVGILVGRKDDSKNVLCGDNSDNNVSDNDTDLCDNDMGNNSTKINNRCNMDRLYENGKITNEYAKSVLKIMLSTIHGLSETEKDAIIRGIELINVQMEYEKYVDRVMDGFINEEDEIND